MPVKIKALEQAIAKRQLTRPKALNLQPTKAEALQIKSAFTRKTETQPTPKAQAEYKQPMPIKIKAMEKTIAERQVPKAETPKPEARKSWFTPATERTKPMTEAINKAIQQHKATQPSPERPSTQTQDKFSKAKDHAKDKVRIRSANCFKPTPLMRVIRDACGYVILPPYKSYKSLRRSRKKPQEAR